MSRKFKITHQATANRWSLSSYAWCLLQRDFVFLDVRTDTTRENNDQLFGRGLVDQYVDIYFTYDVSECTVFFKFEPW